MANETLVHRWDAEAGAGIDGPAMDPVIAADAVDEYLDFAVSATRAILGAPAGPPSASSAPTPIGSGISTSPRPGGARSTASPWISR